MVTHEFQKRVRYGETDRMGYLYYGHYAQYYEIGRVEMLRALGLSYKTMEEAHGIIMPVVSLQMRYVRPALYDELITIRTTLKKMPDRHITFEVELFNEQGKLVNGGSVRLCFVLRQTQRTTSAPAFLIEKLKPHFETPEEL